MPESTVVAKPPSTAPDLKSMREELARMTREIDRLEGRGEEPAEDKPLKTPVPFYNPRYKWERFNVPGVGKRKFLNGKFVAKTERELERMREKAKAGSYIFEGDDLKPENALIDNKGQRWLNSKAYQWTMRHDAR